MTASISAIPVWKKDSTPVEWLQELASMALEHPEWWARVVVVYEEANAEVLLTPSGARVGRIMLKKK